MMRTPKEYEPNELLHALLKLGPRLRNNFFRVDSDLPDLIRSSVGANTFRSFSGLSRKPSEIFRKWADAHLTRRTIDQLSEITTQTQYDHFLDASVASITLYWLEHGKRELRIGAARKLANLLLKNVVRFTGIEATARATLIALLHVPHDLFCLAAVRRSASSGQFGLAFSIPKNASMGFIKSAAQYDNLQGLLRRIAATAGEPPISIDLVAWNHAHRR